MLPSSQLGVHTLPTVRSKLRVRNSRLTGLPIRSSLITNTRPDPQIHLE